MNPAPAPGWKSRSSGQFSSFDEALPSRRRGSHSTIEQIDSKRQILQLRRSSTSARSASSTNTQDLVSSRSDTSSTSLSKNAPPGSQPSTRFAEQFATNTHSSSQSSGFSENSSENPYTLNWVLKHSHISFPPGPPELLLDSQVEKDQSMIAIPPQTYNPFNLIYTEGHPGVSEACVWEHSRRVPTHPAFSMIKLSGSTLIPFAKTSAFETTVIAVEKGEIALKTHKVKHLGGGHYALARTVFKTGALFVIPPDTSYSIENYHEEALLKKFTFNN